MRPTPLLALLASFVLAPAAAETVKPKNPTGQALLHKAQAALRDAREESARLAAEKEALGRERDALAARVQALEATAARLSALEAGIERERSAARGLAADVATRDRALATARAEAAEGEHRLVERERELNAARASLAAAGAAGSALDTRLGECTAKNTELAARNAALRDREAHAGFWQRAQDAEPVLGFGQVRKENALEDERLKARALTLPAPEQP